MAPEWDRVASETARDASGMGRKAVSPAPSHQVREPEKGKTAGTRGAGCEEVRPEAGPMRVRQRKAEQWRPGNTGSRKSGVRHPFAMPHAARG
ncbi:hypothetical protein GCM10007301_25410 [Azorhizobium oxalatiphilum]|uniref:Uncharacterized protein n=1 Tax=Azorhizobium oxalatiphilum TaxID=980631 RepID=A0A917FBA5_9HYPH|nr:hypothetical protein GCM10007301_25410 [Azorhizobium oxalatiphilum]